MKITNRGNLETNWLFIISPWFPLSISRSVITGNTNKKIGYVYAIHILWMFAIGFHFARSKGN
jgi:hypothetical protein